MLFIISNRLLFGYIQDVISDDLSPKTEIYENGDNTPMSHEIYSPLPAAALFWERSSTKLTEIFEINFVIGRSRSALRQGTLHFILIA